MIALAYVVVGFALLIGGIALWSTPLACVVAGLFLMFSGGLAMKETKR